MRCVICRRDMGLVWFCMVYWFWCSSSWKNRILLHLAEKRMSHCTEYATIHLSRKSLGVSSVPNPNRLWQMQEGIKNSPKDALCLRCHGCTTKSSQQTTCYQLWSSCKKWMICCFSLITALMPKLELRLERSAVFIQHRTPEDSLPTRIFYELLLYQFRFPS